MKLRIEEAVGEEEIVIYCKERSERLARLQWAIESIILRDGEMVLTLNGNEHYVSKREILFFETDGGRITAHTRERMLYASGTLRSIEQTLPHCFVRASKSCIVNAAEVCALSKNFTGLGEVLFRNSAKKVYVSRGYYRELKQKIYELHELDGQGGTENEE